MQNVSNPLPFNTNRARMRAGLSRISNLNSVFEVTTPLASVNDATSLDAWENMYKMDYPNRHPFDQRMTGHHPADRLYGQPIRQSIPASELKQTESLVDNILYPTHATFDDKMAKFASHAERKAKKSLEYRSGFTRDKFERYFTDELDNHEKREWWNDPQDEYSARHVTF